MQKKKKQHKRTLGKFCFRKIQQMQAEVKVFFGGIKIKSEAACFSTIILGDEVLIWFSVKERTDSHLNDIDWLKSKDQFQIPHNHINSLTDIDFYPDQAKQEKVACKWDKKAKKAVKTTRRTWRTASTAGTNSSSSTCWNKYISIWFDEKSKIWQFYRGCSS